MTELFPITFTDQVLCLEREIRKRRSVYPRLIAQRRLTQAEADREIATMESVAARFRAAPPEVAPGKPGATPLGPPWAAGDLHRIACAVRALHYAFAEPDFGAPRSLGLDAPSMARLRILAAPALATTSARMRDDGGVQLHGIHFFIDDGGEADA